MKYAKLLLFVFLIFMCWGLGLFGRSLSAADLYQGQVVDEQTGQPLVGAVITVVWYKTPAVQMEGSLYFQNAQETETDSQGKFSLLVSPGIDWNPLTVIIKDPTIVIYQPVYEPVNSTWLLRMGFKSHTELAAALKKGLVVKLSKLKTEKELRYFSDTHVHPDVPNDRIPKLIKVINIQRRKLGLPQFPEGK